MFPNTGLMKLASHAPPFCWPPLQVPPATPSFGVGSPSQTGHGRLCVPLIQIDDELATAVFD